MIGAPSCDVLLLMGEWYTDLLFSLLCRAGPRILIFNQQGRTEAIDFLDRLHASAKRADGASFDRVMFCTNVTYAATGYKRGIQVPLTLPSCPPPYMAPARNRNQTSKLTSRTDFVNHQYDPEAIKKLTVQHAFAERWAQLDPKADVSVVPTIEESINQARANGKDEKSLAEGETVQVLITGSLHLVGGALGILEGADAL